MDNMPRQRTHHRNASSSAPGTAGFAYVNQDSSSDSYSDGEDEEVDSESSAMDYGEEDSDASSLSDYHPSNKMQRHFGPQNQGIYRDQYMGGNTYQPMP